MVTSVFERGLTDEEIVKLLVAEGWPQDVARMYVAAERGQPFGDRLERGPDGVLRPRRSFPIHRPPAEPDGQG